MNTSYRIIDNILYFRSNLTFENTQILYKQLLSDKEKYNKIDLYEVNNIDSSGVALLDELIDIADEQIELVQVGQEHQKLIKTFRLQSEVHQTSLVKINFFEKIFNGLNLTYTNTKDMFLLTSEVVVWSILDLFSSKGRKKGAVFQQSILLGVDAFTIIALMSLILGLILALQSAAQLRQFGANIFVADMLAISMVREMGPMMTAIIIAGRSGSSIASEIATMKVSEELDALKTMAVNPIRYIVVPKFIAITFCMPLLVILSITTGILGGLIVAVTYLDLSMYAFFTELFNALTIKDITIGLSKSFFFAWNIVLIGSYFGLRVKGGAEGVGKVTTASVVVSIFSVIIFDAIFSLFYMF